MTTRSRVRTTGKKRRVTTMRLHDSEMPRGNPHRGSHRARGPGTRCLIGDGITAGFTLIEVLVALAVVALSLPVVGSVMFTSIKATVKVEQRVKLLAAYRTLELTLLDRSRLSPGVQSGEIDEVAWAMDVRPFDLGVPAAQGQRSWLPLAITTTLRSASGETFQVETIRLVRIGAP
jgi:general secretion pathway protein I